MTTSRTSPPAAPPLAEEPAMPEAAAAGPEDSPPPSFSAGAATGRDAGPVPVESVSPLTAAIPRYDDNPAPVYPRLARARGWEGEVLLRVLVAADGTVGSVRVEKSSGYEILDRTALEAVWKWRFIPAHRGALPVAAEVLVPVPFQLQPR